MATGNLPRSRLNSQRSSSDKSE